MIVELPLRDRPVQIARGLRNTAARCIVLGKMLMNNLVNQNLETDIPANRTRGTFGSVWRSYCTNSMFMHSGMPILRRVLASAVARLIFRHVRGVGFKHLSSAGYEVETIDDGAMPLKPDKLARRDMPEHWKNPFPLIKPYIVKLREATLFSSGVALMRDRRFCSIDGKWNCVVGSQISHKGEHACLARAGIPNGPVYFYPDRATRSALVRRRLRCSNVSGRCFYARCNEVGSRNFGHFVNDVLSLIYYEDLGAITPGQDRVIAPAMSMPMQEALFQKVFGGYEILQVSRQAVIPLKTEELLIPGKLSASERFNPAAIASLAKRMRRIMAPYVGHDKRKLCVSRRDGRRRDDSRNFANVGAYETRMRELGYDVVEVSTLDTETQFSLFANATDIVGIHGAGMMNMIMMPMGGNYTEIAPCGGLGDSPVSIARCAMAAGHKVAGLAGIPCGNGPPEIDIGQLERLLLDAS